MSSPFTCTKISHSHGNTDKINDIVSLFVFSLCLFDVMEILPLFFMPQLERTIMLFHRQSRLKRGTQTPANLTNSRNIHVPRTSKSNDQVSDNRHTSGTNSGNNTLSVKKMHLTPSKQNTNNANNTTCFPCNCLPPKQKMQSIQSLNLYTKIPPKHVTRQFSPTKTKMQSIQSLILCTKLPPKHITCQFSASPAIHGTNIVFTYITNIQIHMYICIIKNKKIQL